MTPNSFYVYLYPSSPSHRSSSASSWIEKDGNGKSNLIKPRPGWSIKSYFHNNLISLVIFLINNRPVSYLVILVLVVTIAICSHNCHHRQSYHQHLHHHHHRHHDGKVELVLGSFWPILRITEMSAPREIRGFNLWETFSGGGEILCLQALNITSWIKLLYAGFLELRRYISSD